MKLCLLLLSLFNLIDTAATLHFTRSGIMTELNPFMAVLLEYPALFVAVKVLAMTAIVIYLWANRQHKFARIGTRIGVVLYGCIAIYYIIIFGTIGG